MKKFLPTVRSLVFLLIASTLLNACTAGRRTANLSQLPVQESTTFVFPYHLNQPDASFELPDRLVEISGLSLSANGRQLFAVQDEEGIIFVLDAATGKIETEIPFGKNGDYEGIEKVGEDVFVVKSSGNIYQVKNWETTTPETSKYDTPLTKDHDVEGLGYDAKTNSLLLACKDQPNPAANDEVDFSKTIYRFPLGKMQLDTMPALVVTRQNILDYFQNHPLLNKVKKDGEIKEVAPEELPYFPSAIAVHPLTGEYYITSSKGKTLFVLSPAGRILDIEELDKQIHPQPEGLAFASDGTLYLSNEGDGGKARIYRFSYRITKN